MKHSHLFLIYYVKKYLFIGIFPGSDYRYMFTPCMKHSLHIFTTVSHGKATICKGKYCISLCHFISHTVYLTFGKGILLKQNFRRVSDSSSNYPCF